MCAATSESTPNGRDDRGPITDAGVAAVLRPFVRATRPLLGALSDSDPFGLAHRARRAPAATADERKLNDKVLDRLAESHVPGTAAWAQMDADERSRWWVRRVGRLTSLVAAVPGFGGVITSRLPITTALGAVAQGLVLCAVADEHGVHDEAEVVALLGAVMFHRDLSPTPRAELTETTDAQVDARADELTGDLKQEKAPARRPGQRLALAAAGRGGGREVHRRVSGLKQAAKAGENWIHARHG